MHTWQTALRSVAADWTLLEYFRHVHAGLATEFQPEDIHIATLAGGAQSARPRRHDFGRLVSQQSDARAYRRRGRRADRERHSAPPSCTARPSPIPGRRTAFLGSAASPCEVERLLRGKLADRRRPRHPGMAVLGPHYSTSRSARMISHWRASSA